MTKLSTLFIHGVLNTHLDETEGIAQTGVGVDFGNSSGGVQEKKQIRGVITSRRKSF